MLIKKLDKIEINTNNSGLSSTLKEILTILSSIKQFLEVKLLHHPYLAAFSAHYPEAPSSSYSSFHNPR